MEVALFEFHKESSRAIAELYVYEKSWFQVLVAIGTEPRIELAEPSFLEVDRVNGGFAVNTELEARTHLYVVSKASAYNKHFACITA